MAELEEIFQHVLENIYKAHSVRVVSCEKIDICKLGDNYSSEVFSVKVSFLMDDEDLQDRRWVVKRPFSDQKLYSLMSSDRAFQNEFVWYHILMPEYLAENQIQVPICHYVTKDILILEDLTVKGYELPYRQKGLSTSQLEEAIKALAQIHGASLKLRSRNPAKYQEVIKQFSDVMKGNEFFCKVFNLAIRRASNKLRECHMQEESEKLSLYSVDDFLPLSSGCKPTDGFFRVICHGDFWANNILFKGNEVQMVDFQRAREGPMAVDILTLIETSCSLHQYDNTPLYCLYYEQLEGTGAQPPPFSDFMKHIQSYMLYGLLVGVFYITSIVIEEHHVRSLSVLAEDSFFSDGNQIIEKSPEYAERLLFVVKKHKKFGFV